MSGIVLSLCDYTGVMDQPWLEAGYECWIVDTRHEPGVHRNPDNPNLVRVGTDVRDWLPPRMDYVMAFAFPPCTHLAVSGARWFRKKDCGHCRRPSTSSARACACVNGPTPHGWSRTRCRSSPAIIASRITHSTRAIMATRGRRKLACGRATALPCPKNIAWNRFWAASSIACRLRPTAGTCAASRPPGSRGRCLKRISKH